MSRRTAFLASISSFLGNLWEVFTVSLLEGSYRCWDMSNVTIPRGQPPRPTTGRRVQQRRALMRPTMSRLVSSDILSIAAAVIIVVTGLWATRGGGWSDIQKGGYNWWRASSSLSGLYTSLSGIFGLLLASRTRWIERAIGLDKMLIWHRVMGDMMGILLGVHIFTSIPAEMQFRGGLMNTIRDMVGREPYMALTTVGAAIVGIVVISSLKNVRNKLSYETWYFMHLTVYFGLAASFSHQITLGSLLSNDRLTRIGWVIACALVFATALVGRWWRVLQSVSNPLHVRDIRRETPETVSVLLGGRNILAMRGDAGQFIMMRSLIPGQWWKTNPYSLSNAPTTAGMRVTIKDRGDASRAVRRLQVGDRVAVEGPYGVTTPLVFNDHKPLFIAGGVGITPVVAMMQRLPADSNPIVLLRARKEADVAHLAELQQLAAQRGGEVVVLTGATAAMKGNDPFAGQALLRAVPDLQQRAALVCGPNSLLFAARKGLLEAGMKKNNIHVELPWW